MHRKSAVAVPFAQRHVHRVALALSAPHFAELARAREPRELVDGDAEHLVRVVEDRLGAVAVVGVDVHHHDALQAVAPLEVARPKGRVVEQAEPHAAVRLGVVARRSDGRKPALDAAGPDLLHQVEHRPRRQAGRLVGSLRGLGVEVEGGERAARPLPPRARCRRGCAPRPAPRGSPGAGRSASACRTARGRPARSGSPRSAWRFPGGRRVRGVA